MTDLDNMVREEMTRVAASPKGARLTIARLEAIVEHIKVAHAGLLQAQDVARAFQRLMEVPYMPQPLQKVAPGFDAINRAHGALLLLIRDLKTDG